MKNFLKVFDGILEKATNFLGVVAGFLILFTGFMIVYEVIARGIFGKPTEWVMELSTYCVVISGFFGMAVTYAAKKHIHVDLLLMRLSEKAQCRLGVFTCIVGLIYTSIFTVKSWQMAMLSMELNNCAPSTLGTPLWIPQISLPIGFFFLSLQILSSLLHNIDRLSTNDFAGEAKGAEKC